MRLGGRERSPRSEAGLTGWAGMTGGGARSKSMAIDMASGGAATAAWVGVAVVG